MLGVVNPSVFRYIDDVGREVRPNEARPVFRAGFFHALGMTSLSQSCDLSEKLPPHAASARIGITRSRSF
ncbi:hypothetical protein DF036_06860 [Burkholderia contaminans]|nr:hypothetical protein DF036_06860 [Burkholderia contaminans]